MGVHSQTLAEALTEADRIFVFKPAKLGWDLDVGMQSLGEKQQVSDSTETLIKQIKAEAHSGDQIVIMSNGGFESLHQRLITALSED
jgi:UDP-N-acetylmuramate: L-alanyl-gamma-D-glutamyl-meso-diaminopimelate ligase